MSVPTKKVAKKHASASTPSAPRLLIEEWLPIAEIGIESLRERTPMTPFPAPNRLHVWWARRPLVASRAAILASLLPANADREKFMHILGIHGDPMASRARIDESRRSGERFEGAAYSYRRAFTYAPSSDERTWIAEHTNIEGAKPVVLDPTAGGGSVPLEAIRLGCSAIANDLNSVSWLVLKATVELPMVFGSRLVARFNEIAVRFVKRRDELLNPFVPAEPEPDCITTNWLWARTVTCPYCSGVVPLSPNWRLDSKGTGVKLVPQIASSQQRHCTFEIVDNAKDHSSGTVKAGDGSCPYPDCKRVIDSDEIKCQAQAGQMGQQLYAVVLKRRVVTGHTKTGKPKVKWISEFRSPRPEDNNEEQVSSILDAKMSEWIAGNVVPDEDVPPGHKTGDEGGAGSGTDKPLKVGMKKWRDMFSPRQLLGHATGVEVFHELAEALREENAGILSPLDRAALVYIAIAIDKLLNYNSRMSVWMPTRGVVANTFNRHDFAFCWSHSEVAPTSTGVGYDWAIEQTGKALSELVELVDASDNDLPMFTDSSTQGDVDIRRGSAESLDLSDDSVDCIVMDPPYYDNVMYAELADFFYVWLKRTAGLIFPEGFVDYLTDKDREAVANPAKFKGQDGGTKNLAGRDYENRMAAIFTECRRVLKSHGVMTVMFTHKASGAWDALASGLVRAGFIISASWPINTEAEGSMHIKEKSAAKSTIFLVCRAREERSTEADAIYWEEVEPLVAAKVRERVGEFQAAGIGGIDLYLASFGPALQVFSEHWPLQRGRALQKPKTRRGELFAKEDWDPYAVRPEDALDAARREVKRWRLEQLATVKRQHHLDPLTEWYMLAWDAFRAPRFPADEALKLARVVGLDFDTQVKNIVCEVKSSDVILWDSKTRQSKGKLGGAGGDVAIDTLHHAAVLGRDQNTGAAQAMLERGGLLNDATLMTALEAMLNVLPPPAAGTSGKKADASLTAASSDFEALEKLRRLAFADQVPEPKLVQREIPGIVDAELDDSDE